MVKRRLRVDVGRFPDPDGAAVTKGATVTIVVVPERKRVVNPSCRVSGGLRARHHSAVIAGNTGKLGNSDFGGLCLTRVT